MPANNSTILNNININKFCHLERIQMFILLPNCKSRYISSVSGKICTT